MLTWLAILIPTALAGSQLETQILGPLDTIVLEETLDLPYEETHDVEIAGVLYKVALSAEQDGNAVKVNTMVSYMKKGKKETFLCQPKLSLTPNREERSKKPSVIPKGHAHPEGEVEPPVLYWQLTAKFVPEAEEAPPEATQDVERAEEPPDEATRDAERPEEGAAEEGGE